MKIDFKKINRSPIPFNESSGDIEFQGNLKYDSTGLVKLSAVISGKLDLTCDLCGLEFSHIVQDDISFLISEGIYTSQDNKLDIVELDGNILDTQEMLSSEIDFIKSDYHKCDDCKYNERN